MRASLPVIGLTLLLVVGVLVSNPTLAQQRVISTDASITRIVMALDRADTLVAVDVTSDLPAEKADLPRVGYHRALSAEGLLSLNPDLLLASEHAGPAATLQALKKAQIPIETLSAPLSIDTLESNVRQIGEALGATQEAARLTAEIEQLRHRVQGQALDGETGILLRVAEGGLRAAGTETAGGSLLKLLGVRNLADHPGYRSYSEESILALEPAIVVFALGPEDSLESMQKQFPLLRYTPAMNADRFVAVDASALVGGLSIASLEQAEQLLTQVGARTSLPSRSALRQEGSTLGDLLISASP